MGRQTLCRYESGQPTCTAMNGGGSRGGSSAGNALLQDVSQAADGDGGGGDPVVRPPVIVEVLHFPLPPGPHVGQEQPASPNSTSTSKI